MKTTKRTCAGCQKKVNADLLLFTHGRDLCPPCDEKDSRIRGIRLRDDLTGAKPYVNPAPGSGFTWGVI